MNRLRTIRPVFAAICAAITLSCAGNSVATDTDSANTAPGNNAGANPAPAPGTGQSQSQEGDWAAIEKIEAEAKALALTTGCAASGECRAAPVGSRACGGPRYYLPYCAKSTDSAALYRKLEAVTKAEQAFNAKYQIVSTCEFRMPPEVGVTGGACKEQ